MKKWPAVTASFPKKRLLFFSVFLLSLLLALSCSVLDPLSLTREQERLDILDEILLKNRAFHIRRKDQEALLALARSRNPKIRLAVVKVLENNPSPESYDALVAAMVDEDGTIAREAARILAEQWDNSAPAVLKAMDSKDTHLAEQAVKLLRFKKDSQYASRLLAVLDNPSPSLRKLAALTYGELGDYNSPLFQERLHSPVKAVSASAVSCFPYFKNPDLIPVLILYAGDSNALVSSAALFGISDFGIRALPYIERAMKGQKSQNLRLKLLELIEGEQSPAAVPLLVSLLEDEDSRIARRAEDILLKMGPKALPVLIQAGPKPDSRGFDATIRLLGTWHDSKGIPTLIQALGQADQRDRAKKILLSFGEEAAADLIAAVDNEKGEIGSEALDILIETRNPSLISGSSGEGYSVNRLFYLFETLDEKTLTAYLDEVPFSPEERKDLKTLYALKLDAQAYDRIMAEKNAAAYPYFFALRAWEKSSLSAELSRRNAYDYMHAYIESNVDSWLSASRESRESYETFQQIAKKALSRAMSAKNSAGKADRDLTLDYLKRRRDLIEGWKSCGAGIRDMALLIFLDYSLDIQTLVKNYDYFRALPSSARPWPEGFS